MTLDITHRVCSTVTSIITFLCLFCCILHYNFRVLQGSPFTRIVFFHLRVIPILQDLQLILFLDKFSRILLKEDILCL